MEWTKLGSMGAAALALAALGACGGKVAIDGSGGAGGTGTNTSSTSSSGTGTSSSSTSSSGAGGSDPQSGCAQACAAMNQIPGCADPGCTESCVAEFAKAGACQQEFFAVIECAIETAGVGGQCVGEECFALMEQYEGCLGGPNLCAAGACASGSDGSCACDGVCNGNAVKAQCFAQSGTMPACLCSVNGVDVGKCQSSPGAFPCDIDVGCCAMYFQ